MAYDNDLIAGKLRRWEKYLDNFRLPAWEDIPDFGLYMEQVIGLLKQYLDYLPPELKEEQFITAATINNYVRTKIMPVPRRKKYYRIHIAYLIVILTLKQSLSIALVQKLIPMNLTEDEVEAVYRAYARRHMLAAKAFTMQIRAIAGPILHHSEENEFSTEKTEDLIAASAIMGGFSRLLAEKLLLLDDADPEKVRAEELAGDAKNARE
ncbi:MAG: DUF1836 domain-containing protein [Oscillospiraceae bacterium]|nr:DUF1836 domain-containing protein [Oscillospiraceae bacterium]MBQ3879296.1 DUF1836 domain-containing protein [Oscillospiraceae bacterium]